jgi:hypothetical protein
MKSDMLPDVTMIRLWPGWACQPVLATALLSDWQPARHCLHVQI